MENRVPLEVHIGPERLLSFIVNMTEERLWLQFPDQILPEGLADLTVFFRFRNSAMTFSTRVVEATEDTLELVQPTELFRNLNRAFERIQAPPSVGVTFLYKGQQVRLDYPDSEQYDPAEAPEADPGFDATRVADLLQAFRERSERFAAENKIIMFRERTPTTFQEKLITKSGQILVLPFYTAEGQIRSEEIRDRLLTQDEVIAFEAEAGEDMFTVLERIGSIVAKNRDNRIWHELYCPVLYHQYVVAYLYLIRTESQQDRFDPAVFEFVVQFARILAYSLKANGYFKADPVVDEFSGAQLMDISGSGLLFSYPQDGPPILLYTDLDLKLHLPNTTIPVRGRVMRKFNDENGSYIAIQFIELDPDDMEILFLEIYGERYRGDVDSVGVADPENLPPDEM